MLADLEINRFMLFCLLVSFEAAAVVVSIAEIMMRLEVPDA